MLKSNTAAWAWVLLPLVKWHVDVLVAFAPHQPWGRERSLVDMFLKPRQHHWFCTEVSSYSEASTTMPVPQQ